MSHHIVGALYVFTLYYKSMDNVTMKGGFFAQSFYFGLVWKKMPAWACRPPPSFPQLACSLLLCPTPRGSQALTPPPPTIYGWSGGGYIVRPQPFAAAAFFVAF